ncbi:hypothetical protein EDB81DRAFT_664175, partial [Dactylonectria macrodidyma]
RSGVAYPWESGGCPGAQGLDRDGFAEFLVPKGPHGLISKNLLEWIGSFKREVDERSWNGQVYECFLCHRTFNVQS